NDASSIAYSAPVTRVACASRFGPARSISPTSANSSSTSASPSTRAACVPSPVRIVASFTGGCCHTRTYASVVVDRDSQWDHGGESGRRAAPPPDSERRAEQEASFLMDRPPGGWGDLVTNKTLHLELDALRAEFRAEMAALSASVDRRLRTQTLVMTTT